MHATTKRKAPVRCAAANDDDDFGEVLGGKEPQADAARGASSGSRADAAASGAQGAKKRRKEFAWMDSDDEDSDQKDDHDPDCADDAENAKEDNADGEAVSVEALDQVHSFGRMMLLSPSVSRRLRGGDLGPPEVSAVCRALSRTKFFDRELLDDLYDAVRTMLAASKLTVPQTSDVVRCLKALNAYDRDVCAAISRCFSSRTGEMEVGTRTEWLESFKGFNHAEPDFLQLLEVPPVPPTHPNYKKVRCWHFSRGACALEGACTFSHDPSAPLSLADGTKEDWWKCKSSIMMTQNQKTLGHGSYGTGPLGVNPM